MTPEERVRQAFKPYDDVVMGDPGGHGPDEKAVLDLVRVAIAEEREACARLFLELAYDPEYQRLDALSGDYMIDAEKIAAAIRART